MSNCNRDYSKWKETIWFYVDCVNIYLKNLGTIWDHTDIGTLKRIQPDLVKAEVPRSILASLHCAQQQQRNTLSLSQAQHSLLPTGLVGCLLAEGPWRASVIGWSRPKQFHTGLDLFLHTYPSPLGSSCRILVLREQPDWPGRGLQLFGRKKFKFFLSNNCNAY